MKMTNSYNRFIYRLWAPIYDAAVGGLFQPGRKRAFDILDLKPGERVLLVGVGTGADLPLLPAGVRAVGIDLSPAMLAKARSRLPLTGREVELVEGDAQKLLVEEAGFDAVVFNLILSVIPDGRACLRENLRALKPGSRAVIFDKFLPDAGRLTPGRRLLNIGSTLFGTDINRRFCDMAGDLDLVIIRDEPSIMNGLYRVILFKKISH